MTQEQFDKLVEILGNIGGIAYQSALRQVYIDAWISLFLAVLGVAILLASAYFLVRLIRWVEEEDENGHSHREHFDAVPGYVCVCISFLVGGVLLLTDLPSAISLWGNPQWFAIKYLAQLIVGGG